jgi:hypothetical protein
METLTISQLTIGLLGPCLTVVTLLLTKTRILDVILNVSDLHFYNQTYNGFNFSGDFQEYGSHC